MKKHIIQIIKRNVELSMNRVKIIASRLQEDIQEMGLAGEDIESYIEWAMSNVAFFDIENRVVLINQ